MPDMIPATHIAAVALRRIEDASAKLTEVSPQVYSREHLKEAQDAIAVALELLALIVPASVFVPQVGVMPCLEPIEPAPMGQPQGDNFHVQV